MIRVLQCVNRMDRAGLETMLMNYYRNIDRSKVQFDFLTHRSTKGAYDDEIVKMGGKIYYAPRLMPYNIFKYRKYMKKLFEENNYVIVHSHIDTMSFFPLREAKRNNIKYRISHSHTSKLDFDFKLPIKYYCKIFINEFSNIRLSCGNRAGKFLYKNLDFKIVNNAIDCEKFKFDENVRKKIRDKFNISNSTTVIGHVGRYIYIKNQEFLIEVFHHYLKLNPDSLLLLVGMGEDEQKLKEKVKKLNIEKNVLFLINRNDTNDLYQIMDYFVMPSLFEGVPLVAIEAQSNGLPCILSDKISDESRICNNLSFLDLKLGAENWAEYIFNTKKERNINAINDIKENNYDIKIEALKLQKFYETLVEELER